MNLQYVKIIFAGILFMSLTIFVHYFRGWDMFTGLILGFVIFVAITLLGIKLIKEKQI